MSRLATHIVAGALIRRVSDAGGSAMVLARGDRDGGMILVLASERGANLRFLEQGRAADGSAAVVRCGPDPVEDDSAATEYWQRRRRSDPDLWVIEVDIAAPERFVDETILND